jgi:predicted Zn-dependent peptidase
MTVSDLSVALDPATVRRTTLPNGLRVLVRRDDSAPVVAIVTYVSAGYFDETDDVVGIAHVLEHMYFKGTPTRGVGEIARQTKAVGGYLNAATIYDHTSYYTVLPSSSFVAGLDVQFDAYANSLIDQAELARELEVIIQSARRTTPARWPRRRCSSCCTTVIAFAGGASVASRACARWIATRCSASIATSTIRATRCSSWSGTSIPTRR